MKRLRSRSVVLALLAAVPAISLVPGVNANYWLHNLILVVMWSVIGMAWNLLSGYCGQVSFGHAAFFGIGAYTAGLLYAKLGLRPGGGSPRTIPVRRLLPPSSSASSACACAGRSSPSRRSPSG